GHAAAVDAHRVARSHDGLPSHAGDLVGASSDAGESVPLERHAAEGTESWMEGEVDAAGDAKLVRGFDAVGLTADEARELRDRPAAAGAHELLTEADRA